jgi:hypothetical protein
MPQPATSSPWVDRLFARIGVRYGAQWLRMWDGIDFEAVKQDWANELGPIFGRNPHAIAYGMEHLPEYPPTADKFRAICLGAPSAQQALPAPTAKADPRRVAETMAAIVKPDGFDPGRQCADNLRARRDRAGGRLEFAQREQLAALERIWK